MNVILVISDTFRRDHLGAYGGTRARTPELDRFAAESVVFDRAHCCSFPTLPCRAEIFTGRFVFPYLNWGPLPRSEVLLSETFAGACYSATMVTDNLPLSRPGYGYDRGFHSRHRIRGQWYDRLQPKTAPFKWPCPPEKLGDTSDGRIPQYLRNIAIRESEEDWFAPQVVNEAIHWLERNHRRGKFFLYVDMFDAHEPWDPPEQYVRMYDPDGDGDNVFYPCFPTVAGYAEADLRRLRALYAGEISMVDRWFGRLLAAVDGLGLRDDTAICFLSDHGIFLGERGLVGKMGGKRESLKGWPNYSEVARIPMILRVPGQTPGRRQAFVHPGDVGPTLLDLAGIPVPASMNARSLVGVLRGEEESVRDYSVSSWSLRGFSAYRPSVLRTDEWALVFWRAGVQPELYHLPSDPLETRNVYAGNVGVARELHRKYTAFLRNHNAAPMDYLPRHWFMAWGNRSRDSLLHVPADGR